QDGLDLDRGPGLGAELGRVVDLEAHLDLVVGELYLVDLAHPYAGDAHLVVDLQTARLGEHRMVGVATTDHRQVVGTQRSHHHGRHDDEAHGPDDDRVAFPERSHPRSHLSEPVVYFTGIEVPAGRLTRPWNSQR